MSILSAQVDRLRELATGYDELQAGTVRVVRISLNTGSVLREAADTILSLRDKAQELQAENAKLRELLRFALLRCNADNPMCDACTDGYDGVCELEQRMFELGVIE